MPPKQAVAILRKAGVKRVVVRDPSRARDVAVPAEMISTDWHDLINDAEIQVIVELIGGTTTAYELVCAALRAKKIVVTGNKALLAERGDVGPDAGRGLGVDDRHEPCMWM